VMRLNIQSVRDCEAGRSGTEKGPHYVIRRYAELSAAMVGLSESYPHEQVTTLLTNLQEEVNHRYLKKKYLEDLGDDDIALGPHLDVVVSKIF